MILDLPNELWLAAILGAALPDFLRIARGRHNGLPDWLRKPGFYIGFLVLIVLGWIAVRLAYEGDNGLDFFAGLGIGYAAPDFLARLVSKQGSQDGMTIQTEGVGGLRTWWSR